MLPDNERAAIDDLRCWIAERFGPRVRQLVLFGSRARGDGHGESDVDILVVVDDLSSAERRDIGALGGDLLTRHDVHVAPYAVSTAHWEELGRRERRIAADIAREGRPL
jgi:predicted nucleotidyltransferase